LKKRLIPLAALATALVAVGCGSTAQGPGPTPPPTITRTTTVIVRSAPASAPAPAASSQSNFVSCGGYVTARIGTTSCEFANNVFWEFYESEPARDFSAYSPATGESYQVHCAGEPLVRCTAGTGAQVRFPVSAVDVYTDRDAEAYASSHDVGPQTSTADAQPAPDSAPDSSGSGSFCGTHTCIDNFANGTGYIVQCEDGEWSHSGGRPGACSYHGGETGRTYP
jgi:hypothetical protein